MSKSGKRAEGLNHPGEFKPSSPFPEQETQKDEDPEASIPNAKGGFSKPDDKGSDMNAQGVREAGTSNRKLRSWVAFGCGVLWLLMVILAYNFGKRVSTSCPVKEPYFPEETGCPDLEEYCPDFYSDLEDFEQDYRPEEAKAKKVKWKN